MSEGLISEIPFIAQPMFNSPLALHANWVQALMLMAAPPSAAADMPRPGARAPAASSVVRDRWASTGAVDKGYDVLKGIAVIRVSGVLVHRLGRMRPCMGMTGYDGIRLALRNAVNDKGLLGIVLDIDSPGGDVSGCFDLVDDIYRVRGRKPIRAILTENAFSAAYAIASATDRITVPRTGGAGSIGIIAIIYDFSRALTMAGIGVNVIQFGARKADGLPELPLSKAGRARFQANVDTLGHLFVKTVARNRGMKAATIEAMQGGSFMGTDAMRAGLVDAVASPEAAFNEFFATVQTKQRKQLS